MKGPDKVIHKPWGTSQCVLQTPFVELHHILIVDGGYCSEHIHHHKWSRIHIISGVLGILLYSGTGFNTVELKAGEYVDIQPGIKHKFKSSGEVEAFESYWVELCEDIERFSDSGVAEIK